MPIPRKDFEKGLDEETKKVVDFLKSRPNEAFTSAEIAINLGMDRSEILPIVNYLYLNIKAIDRTQIAEIYYYASPKKKES